MNADKITQPDEKRKRVRYGQKQPSIYDSQFNTISAISGPVFILAVGLLVWCVKTDSFKNRDMAAVLGLAGIITLLISGILAFYSAFIAKPNKGRWVSRVIIILFSIALLSVIWKIAVR